MSDEFEQFLRGLRADPRLGRYIPALPNMTPETTVLLLVTALADAHEGSPRSLGEGEGRCESMAETRGTALRSALQ
jgi:hypothetical protein